MKPAFDLLEYQRRLDLVRKSLLEQDLDALVIGDPANMNWLTGFDAWSFYVPQVMLVLHDHAPVWLGRQMDAGAVYLTTYLSEESVRPYSEDLVQRDDVHPMEAIGDKYANLICRVSESVLRVIPIFSLSKPLSVFKAHCRRSTGKMQIDL